MRTAIDAPGDNVYTPPGFADSYGPDGSVIAGQWRREEQTQFQMPITNTPANRYGNSAARIRDAYASYFISDAGCVAWQDEIVFATH